MKTLALIEKAKDGSYGVCTQNLQTTVLWGEGNTVAEAKEMMENQYKEMLQFNEEDNIKTPEELIDIEFEYKYDLSSLFNYYSFINVSKLAEYIGINAGLMRQYKQGNTYISEAQSLRIEQAIRTIGKELSTISIV